MMEIINNGAQFSADRKYRYQLWRIWNSDLPKLMFIGLNPSKAGVTNNDATIRRLLRFSRDMGYGGFYMLNLFAYIETYSTKLLKAEYPIEESTKPGHYNQLLLRIAYQSDIEKVVFCWGATATGGRDQEVKDIMQANGIVPYCFGRTADGSPQHPLRLEASRRLQPYV